MKIADRIALHDYAIGSRRIFLRPSLWTRVRRALRCFFFGRIK